MRTVGQILKEERENKFYSLDEIEKITKIRREFLEALENGEYTKLPPPTFVQGFIKNYGKFLGLDTQKLLAIYRREFSEGKNLPRILETFTNPLDRKRFKLTPAKIITSVVLVLIAIFFGYLWFEYRFLVGEPFLEVSQPPDQLNATVESVEVSGRTDPESKVSINNQEIGVDFSGKFSQKINLKNEVNTIIVIATAKNGKSTKIERVVYLRK